MIHLLRTSRLGLRPCEPRDLDELRALWTDSQVRRFLFDDRSISRAEAEAFVDLSVTTFAGHGYGLWIVDQCDRTVGFVGLRHASAAPANLLFGIRPAFWGRGYATEAASAVLGYAFDALQLDRVAADVDEPNHASVRVLEKLGMSRIRRAIVNGHPLLYYEITAAMMAPR